MTIIKRLQGDAFEKSFYRFYSYMIIFVLLFLLFEYAFGVHFPNLYKDTELFPSVRSFFWNQNDLAVVLVFFSWILLYNRNVSLFVRVLYVVLIMLVMYYNGSKSAMLALLFSLSLFVVDCIGGRDLRGGVRSLLLLGFVPIIVFFIFLIWGDSEVTTSQGVYTLNSIIIDPAINILKLEPTGDVWGSISNRTDAAIFVLTEYMGTCGVGLGPGGSWLVLTFPQYELGGAKSPHNALLQFLVDFGYIFLFLLLWLFAYAIRVFVSRPTNVLQRIRALAILSFPLLGLSQSGAIVTNFTFLSLVIFIVIADGDRVDDLFYREKEQGVIAS